MIAPLSIDNELFRELCNKSLGWWENIKNDRELYVDVRKDNYLNVYYNGGSVLKLSWQKGFRGQIHHKYVPIERKDDYVNFRFEDENILIGPLNTIKINNFEQESLSILKERIGLFFPPISEKGIQANYVIKNNSRLESNGFFIDTEFEYQGNRIDMIWVDNILKRVLFVELKLIGDNRLFEDNIEKPNSIRNQLLRYKKFSEESSKDIVSYYDEVFQIKKKLGIIPYSSKHIASIKEYKIIQKPLLLIGDCTQEWIDVNKDEIQKRISDVAFGCIYHGIGTYTFNVPQNDTRNIYKYAEID